MDEQGYVITDTAQKTTIDGLYAAGDVCIKPLRQVVTATGDGALAATELERYAAAMQCKTGLHPVIPGRQDSDMPTSSSEAENPLETGELFSPAMKTQLDTVFGKMAQPLVLKLYLDDRPVSAELEGYMTALAALTDKLTAAVAEHHASSEMAPCVKVCLADGKETGLAFHGVPGGHEFTSFILGLYNAAGPGQAIDEEVRRKIAAVEHPVEMKLLVTLSCTMCPELVLAAQRIAAENPLVTAEAYDIHHFEGLKNRHKVMSVPCLVINDREVSFEKEYISTALYLISAPNTGLFFAYRSIYCGFVGASEPSHCGLSLICRLNLQGGMERYWKINAK